VARRERQRRLEEFVARRPKALRRFWDLLVPRMELSEIAQELGITERQARR
jgi:hypothetical protein